MRCDTCKHWTPLQDADRTPGGVRKCSGVREIWVVEAEIPERIRRSKIRFEGGEYSIDPAYIDATEVAFSAAKAVVADTSAHAAVLLTRPDFGCVLHTASQ